MVNSAAIIGTSEMSMALGKFGAFLNKDLGTLAKEAGKVLNTDLGTIAKSAGRVLQADLGDLLRDAPAADKPVAERIDQQPAANPPAETALPAKRVAPFPPNVAPTAAAAFDPDATQKMERVITTSVPFNPDSTQKMQAPGTAEPKIAGDAGNEKSAPTPPPEPAKFNKELLLRAQRTAPEGNEVKVLLPYCVGEFERPRATPSGNLTNDPVNAVYSAHGESIFVQLALSWDADEARQLVDEVSAVIGQATHAAPDRSWVIGPTAQGVIFAWTRDCYFFSATSPKGAPALTRFLTAYPH